jgi:glycosyltransferase involved in cell wall biosynthesis
MFRQSLNIGLRTVASGEFRVTIISGQRYGLPRWFRYVGPMRVCVIGSGWQFTSGISYYTHRLSVELARHFDVSVVLMRRLVPRRFYPGRDRVGAQLSVQAYPEDVNVFDGVDWYVVPSLPRSVAFLVRQRPDVVVLQWWSAATFHSYLVLALTARLLRAQVVIEFHEVQDTGEAALPGVARYGQLLGGALVRLAGGFVTHSDYDSERVSQLHPMRDRPLRVIEHGPFDQHAGPKRAAAPDVAPVPEAGAPFRFLFFGTIRPYKGLEYLVQAFNSLTIEEAASRELVVVGETWEGWTQPLELIEASPHRDRITVTNRYVHDDEVTGFFDGCDAVVLPYTRSSASGPLHIAMSRGLPIVLTDVGGLRSGAAGYDGITWVPPQDVDALAWALRELPELPVRRFDDPRSWSHSVDAYAELFSELPGRGLSAR